MLFMLFLELTTCSLWYLPLDAISPVISPVERKVREVEMIVLR